MERTGSIWVARSVDVTTKDNHELVMLIWVHCIITIHWSDSSTKRGYNKYTKKYTVCSFGKKADDSIIRNES